MKRLFIALAVALSLAWYWIDSADSEPGTRMVNDALCWLEGQPDKRKCRGFFAAQLRYRIDLQRREAVVYYMYDGNYIQFSDCLIVDSINFECNRVRWRNDKDFHDAWVVVKSGTLNFPDQMGVFDTVGCHPSRLVYWLIANAWITSMPYDDAGATVRWILNCDPATERTSVPQKRRP